MRIRTQAQLVLLHFHREDSRAPERQTLPATSTKQPAGPVAVSCGHCLKWSHASGLKQRECITLQLWGSASQLGLTRPKSRCGGLHAFCGPQGRIPSCLFQLLEARCIPQLGAPLPSSQPAVGGLPPPSTYNNHEDCTRPTWTAQDSVPFPRPATLIPPCYGT